jgi:1-deoxy-D-xylulose-5-phosphate synthase
LTTAFEQNHPVAVRYPRGSGVGAIPLASLESLPFGKGEIRRVRKGSEASAPRIAILSFGTLLYPALEAAEALDATVVNMRWAKPIDEALLREVAQSHDALVTLEDGAIMGGAGSAVTEALNGAGVIRPVLQLGLPDVFIEHGDPAKLMSLQGLDAAGIEHAIRQRFLEG